MIQSIFLVGKTGEVLIEKHYAGIVTREICEDFWRELKGADTEAELSPIIQAQKKYIVHHKVDSIYILAVMQHETQPLSVLEFIKRVGYIFNDYFGVLDDGKVREQFVVIYELLDEMADNGFPLLTEPNLLKTLISPPSQITQVVSQLSGSVGVTLSEILPSESLTAIPWRRLGIKHKPNEIFFDVIEFLDAIIDSRGMAVSQDMYGEVNARSKLSGMPDLSMHFSDPSLFEDCAFHPCVRYKRFQEQRILSFIPPDGNFRLTSFRASRVGALPVYCSPVFEITGQTGHINLVVGSKLPDKNVIEELTLKIPFSKKTTGHNLTCNNGTILYDDTTKCYKWTIGRLPRDKNPTLDGTFQVVGTGEVEHPVVALDFKIPQYSVANLTIRKLSMTGETYKLYKGARSLTRAGRYEVRT